MREEEKDQTSDFIEFLEFLVNFYKQVERLDSSGRTLQSVFKPPNNPVRYQSFRNWLINLDIWGSFYPLNIQCYDIQLTRTAAYVSLTQYFMTILIDQNARFQEVSEDLSAIEKRLQHQ